MELDIKNFTNYLTNTYANYINTIHNFVPAQYKYSLEGEFGGLNKKYSRILINVNKANSIESYYKAIRKKIDLDLTKKQINYGFILFKNTNLLDKEQFNVFVENLLNIYVDPMNRVENLFRKCKLSCHKDVSLKDEYKPIGYSEYSVKLFGENTNDINQNLIDSSYFRYISKWIEEDIEYIHSFIALDNFDDIQAGDILGVKDFDKANKDKIYGNITRPSTYFDVDWRTI